MAIYIILVLQMIVCKTKMFVCKCFFKALFNKISVKIVYLYSNIKRNEFIGAWKAVSM